MKNKIGRLFYVFLLICFISILGIGKVFAASNPIKLTKIDISEKSNGVDATIVSKNDNLVNTDVTYYKVDGYIVYKLTFLNTDSKDYSIKSFSDNSSNPYLYYTCDNYKDRIIRAGQSIDVLVKETYYKEVDDLDDRNQLSNVKFIFSLVDESGDEVVTEVVVNPFTGDKIFIYMVVLAVALTLFLFFLIFKGKKKKKKTKTLVIIIMLLLTPIITKALDIEFDVTLKNAIKLYDKLKVTYTVNGNSSITSTKYDTSVTEPRTPNRNGYTFEGWFVGNSKYNFANNLTEDISLDAKYTKDTYTITYDLNGGEETTNPSTFTRDNLPISLNAPTKDGFKFVGWIGSNGSTPEEDVYIDEEYQNLNYTAVYEADEYNIYYSGLTEEEENNLNNPDTYNAGDVITLNNPSNRKDNFGEDTERFVGWEDEIGNVSTNVTIKNTLGSVEYEAKWSTIDPTVYSITYNLNGGTVNGTNPNEYTKQTNTFTLINPTKEGYTFVGWTGSNGTVPEVEVTIEIGTREDLNFEAVYEVNNYNITYNLDGGEATNPATYTVEDEITLVNPTKRGYTFTGWTGTDIADNSMNVTIPVNSTEDREFTATYQINTYNITYTLNGGTATNPATYTVLDNIRLNNPEKEGYTFLGWTGSNGTTPEAEVIITDSIGDLEYVANYNAGNYTIHFDKNDTAATGTMDDEIMTVDESKALTKNKFSKAGYDFDGWSTESDGTGTTYTDEESVTNLVLSGSITLYAKWKTVKTATFMSGPTFSGKIKQLAGQSGAGSGTKNTSILKIKYAGTVPAEYQTSTNKVSDASSEEPIYAWFDNGTIYYGSEADKLYLGKDASYMFSPLAAVTEIDTNFYTDNTLNMTQMFWGDHELQVMDVSHFNTSNVNSMASMFGENQKMPSFNVKDWDVRNVKTFQYMFNQCYTITELDLSGWHTDSVTNTQNMFSSTEKLETLKIDNFNTSKVTNMQKMFDNMYSIKSLDLRHLDVSKATSFNQLFENCKALTDLDISTWNTASLKTTDKMFSGAYSLQTIDLSSFNTSKVTSMSNMFINMTSLTTIYAGDGFVTSAMTSNPVMFSNDTNLVGGAGTTYANGQTKSEYAHIDGGTANPGYFTRK